MKKIKFIFNTLIIILSIQGCKKNTFNISDAATMLENPATLFKKIELIQLETNDSILIGTIGKIQLTNKHIYVLDKTQDCIFIFHSNGKFCDRLLRKGKGPGEYLGLSDFEVDKEGNIEILAYTQLIKYNKDLIFKNTVGLPVVSHYFSRIDEDKLALYHLQSEKRLSIFNSYSNEITYSEFKAPKYTRMLPVNPYKSPFYKYREEVFVKQTFKNELLKISNSQIEKHIVFFPSYPIDFTKLPKNKNRAFYLKTYIEKANPFISEAFHNEKIIQAYCKIKDNGFYYIRNNNISYYFNTFNDGIKYAGNFSSDSITYGYIEPDQLDKYIKSSAFNNLISKDFFVNSSTYNNPVIIKYFFK